MSDSKLLQEAIADAKAVRDTALQNAKAALEEAFTPKLQSMLSDKLEEELEKETTTKIKENDDEDEGDEEKEDDYEDDEEDMDESKSKLKETDDNDEDDEGKDYKDDEEEDMEENVDLDLEAVIKELEEDLAETAGTDQDPTDDDDANDKETITKKDPEADKTDESVELDLEAILEEIEAEELEEDKDLETKLSSNREIDGLKTVTSEQAETIEDYKKAVIFLRDKINEINLLNAKLLYANKLFRSYEMTNEDKVKVIETIDRSTSPREVKLVYSTLAESMRMHNTSNKSTSSITEGASAQIASTKPAQPKTTVITEAINPDRWKKLAGID